MNVMRAYEDGSKAYTESSNHFCGELELYADTDEIGLLTKILNKNNYSVNFMPINSVGNRTKVIITRY